MLDKFKDFLADENGWDMFITGAAGTGKTTSLSILVEHCIANKIDYVVCAYTHKACGILATKLPANSNIMTLHSFLTKRPTINDLATSVQHLETSQKTGKSEEYDVLFVDEYSMIGEKDYMDIGQLMMDEEDNLALRVVYIGDKNQLPPVGDVQAVTPSGDYQVKLTKVYRQAGDNQLLDTLGQLVTMIEGGEPQTLVQHPTFQRGIDLVNKYKPGDILLAYTNERVEQLNRLIAKKEVPDIGDALFSPTTRESYSLVSRMLGRHVYSIAKAYGTDEIARGSKYKTLEHLEAMQCCYFYKVDNDKTYAVVFGHYQYKLELQKHAYAAAEANNAIPADNAKIWALNNKSHSLAKARARAWRNYLTFKECVVCMDFPYAMTVHKSQGSTYDTVLLDTNDLYKCAERDYGLYLKLMYVGISRASQKVYTS